MGSSLSIIELFYNAIPGVYFIYFMKVMNFGVNNSLNNTNHHVDDPIRSGIFISLGIIAGFIFQTFTKLIRAMGLDCIIIDAVINNNYKLNLFEIAKKTIKSWGINKTSLDQVKRLDIFYLMDNYLNTHDANKLPSYYSSRVSLWANVGWANLILTLFQISKYLDYPITFTVFTAIFSLWGFKFFYIHLTAQWDVVLKSFISCTYKTSVVNKK